MHEESIQEDHQEEDGETERDQVADERIALESIAVEGQSPIHDEGALRRKSRQGQSRIEDPEQAEASAEAFATQERRERRRESGGRCRGPGSAADRSDSAQPGAAGPTGEQPAHGPGRRRTDAELICRRCLPGLCRHTRLCSHQLCT
jgi:hypothetical protein